MTNGKQIEATENFIHGVLTTPHTFQQIIVKIGMEREALRTRLHAMVAAKRLHRGTCGGALRYVQAEKANLIDNPPRKTGTTRKTAAARAPAPAAAKPNPLPRTPGVPAQRGHVKSGLSNDIRLVLAEAGRPLTATEVGKLLPQYKQSNIASILSQRARAAEFYAAPGTGAGGRGRKYTLAELAKTQPFGAESSAPAATAPAPAPAPRPDRSEELTTAQAIAELRDHETYLRETAAGLWVAADRFAKIIEALQT